MHAAFAEALRQARVRPVSSMSGPSTVRGFLQADLIDFLHVTIVPIVLGSGVRLWDHLAGMADRFSVVDVHARELKPSVGYFLSPRFRNAS
ncbi:dihydrofolate reductase family protein [Nocardia halotolerans]|uniref:Dihydrofolate reductase family protein n=1 Tax=Nocardia halotolerans TaxID=1755878 RepID=A0ABV8VLM0_9NOCA